MEIANCVDDHEQNQQNGTPGQAHTVVGNLEILVHKNCLQNLNQNGKHQVVRSEEIGLDRDNQNSWIFIVGFNAPIHTLMITPRVVICDKISLVFCAYDRSTPPAAAAAGAAAPA